jgi:uncharacterized lipoprotein YmbA
MRRTTLRKTVLGWMCLATIGCSPLAPRPDLSKFYLLAPMASGTAATPINGNLVIGVGPVDFPEYLRRPDIVTRTSPTEIDVSNNNLWGEPLDKNFNRVLRENLGILLNTQNIKAFPWPRDINVNYQVKVNVQRFEKTSAGQSEMIVQWAIEDGHNGKDLYASETRASTPFGAGDPVGSSALSYNLATLSEAIATEIESLSRRGGS